MTHRRFWPTEGQHRTHPPTSDPARRNTHAPARPQAAAQHPSQTSHAPLEEFFRTVVFGADTAREARRSANTARMDSPGYWLEEFGDLRTQTPVLTTLPVEEQAPKAASPLPGLPAGSAPGASGEPGAALLLGLPALLRTSGIAPQTSLALHPKGSAAVALSGAETTAPQDAPQSPQRAPAPEAAPEATQREDLPILDGGALDAAKLFLHYLEGSEENLEMDFNNVDTSDVTPEQFPGFQKELGALRAAGGGTTTVSLSKTYSTKGAQHAALGHITLKLEGKLTVDENGWHMDGELGSEPDDYDFNRMEPGERSRAAEFSTQAGGWIGEQFNPKKFQIKINGKKAIRGQGTW